MARGGLGLGGKWEKWMPPVRSSDPTLMGCPSPTGRTRCFRSSSSLLEAFENYFLKESGVSSSHVQEVNECSLVSTAHRPEETDLRYDRRHLHYLKENFLVVTTVKIHKLTI